MSGYIWTDGLSRSQLDQDGQINSGAPVGIYGQVGQMDVKVGQVRSDRVQIWMDEQVYLNGLGRYGQTGWVDMDRYVGRHGQTGTYRQTSEQIWMDICWIDMNGHMQVDMDGRVGMNEQVGQIWTQLGQLQSDRLGRYGWMSRHE